MFKILIDDGLVIMTGNKKDVATWINEFNNLRENVLQRNGILEIMLRIWTCIYSREIHFMNWEN